MAKQATFKNSVHAMIVRLCRSDARGVDVTDGQTDRSAPIV